MVTKKRMERERERGEGGGRVEEGVGKGVRVVRSGERRGPSLLSPHAALAHASDL